MFRPNLPGMIASIIGRDVHARDTYGRNRSCPHAIADLQTLAQKTSVRADSSASRGAAGERVQPNAMVMVPSYVTPAPQIGDRFTNMAGQFRVVGVNPRVSVDGRLDHFELSLEPMP